MYGTIFKAPIKSVQVNTKLITSNQMISCLLALHQCQTHQTGDQRDENHCRWQRHHSFHDSVEVLQVCHLHWGDSSSHCESEVGHSWTCGHEVARGIQDDQQGPVDKATKNDAVSLQIWVDSVSWQKMKSYLPRFLANLLDHLWSYLISRFSWNPL